MLVLLVVGMKFMDNARWFSFSLVVIGCLCLVGYYGVCVCTGLDVLVVVHTCCFGVLTVLLECVGCLCGVVLMFVFLLFVLLDVDC